MIRDVRRLLEASPFVPFAIVTSGGMTYPVATKDHADISPTGNQVLIWFDDDSGLIVAGLHVTAIEVRPPVPQAG